MANQGHSQPNSWNGYDHYDENGRKIGSSVPSGNGFKEYDENNRLIGYSEPNRDGGYTHYDNSGRVTGSNRLNSWGGMDHFDAYGNKIGTSGTGFVDGFKNSAPGLRTTGTSKPGYYTHLAEKGTEKQRGEMEYEDSGGCCYIATCVYGSYDCPEVRTLRRFRDNTLKQSAFGRFYYAVSPTVVRHFGHTKLFHRFWRGRLDRLVKRLNDKGAAAEI